eukprot:sb/3469709/
MDRLSYNPPTSEEQEMLKLAEQHPEILTGGGSVASIVGAASATPVPTTTAPVAVPTPGSVVAGESPDCNRPSSQQSLQQHQSSSSTQQQTTAAASTAAAARGPPGIEKLMQANTAEEVQKLIMKSQLNGALQAQNKPRPWFNLLPRQPCATATTKLADLKAHLEAAERERIVSQLQLAMQGNGGGGQLAQLLQLTGGQLTPELLMLAPALMQQLQQGRIGSWS